MLMQESAHQEGLGRLIKSVTFDLKTLEALRAEAGSDEAKVFNLVRGLRAEVESDTETEAVLQPLKERAEHILKDLEERRTTGLAAVDLLSALAAEKETAVKAAKDSGLSPRAFGVHWALKGDADLKAAGIATMGLAREAEALFARFPNAAVNADEERRLRAALYKPLLDLDRDGQIVRVVDRIMAILLGDRGDEGA